MKKLNCHARAVAKAIYFTNGDLFPEPADMIYHILDVLTSEETNETKFKRIENIRKRFEEVQEAKTKETLKNII